MGIGIITADGMTETTTDTRTGRGTAAITAIAIGMAVIGTVAGTAMAIGIGIAGADRKVWRREISVSAADPVRALHPRHAPQRHRQGRLARRPLRANARDSGARNGGDARDRAGPGSDRDPRHRARGPQRSDGAHLAMQAAGGMGIEVTQPGALGRLLGDLRLTESSPVPTEANGS